MKLPKSLCNSRKHRKGYETTEKSMKLPKGSLNMFNFAQKTRFFFKKVAKKSENFEKKNSANFFPADDSVSVVSDVTDRTGRIYAAHNVSKGKTNQELPTTKQSFWSKFDP
jgi:hypothetical protein